MAIKHKIKHGISCSKGMAKFWHLRWSNQLAISSLEKKPVKSGKYDIDYVLLNFSIAHEIDVWGAVASWLVRSTPERVVRVRALAGDIVLCSWARHFTLTVPLSTQVYKWVPENRWGNLAKLRGSDLRWTSIPSRESRNTSSRFMLQKPGYAPAAMSQAWLQGFTHEIDSRHSMQLLSCVELMREERSLLWLQKKRQSPQVQMRAVFVALISKFQSVTVRRKERTRTFRPKIYLRSLKGPELTEFAWQFFWKYIAVLKWIHKMVNLPANEKQSLFALSLTPILQD